MSNILDTIKGGALSGGIAIIGLLYPPAKPIIDRIQADIADGKVTKENIESTLDTALTFAESFTSDEIDAILEQSKLVIHEVIVLETMIEAATNK